MGDTGAVAEERGEERRKLCREKNEIVGGWETESEAQKKVEGLNLRSFEQDRGTRHERRAVAPVTQSELE